ncbi:MAG: FAD:protein FMN transferase [Dorea sp.]|nr:FAD:protein FMN transferase [Dorea sp.]
MKHKKHLTRSLFLVTLLCISLLSGCVSAEKEAVSSLDIFAMDTYMTVTAYGPEGEKATKEAVSEIERLDALLSTGNSDSEIYQINENQGGSLGPDAVYLFERSMELWKQTGGLFDIAIYPVMKAWGFTDQNYQVPKEDTLTDLLKLADPDKILYDEEKQELQLEEGMAIDFGGIAKGYTSSRIMDIYRDCGVSSGLVSLGGNVQALGSKPDGSSWKIAIQNPDPDADYLGVLQIVDKAVITSGGYERYFEQDGKNYHHIIDPATGYPAENGLLSVTIISADGTLADGLSTSLFIMGKEKACEFWREHKEAFDFILLDQDENLWISEGIEKTFTSEQFHINIVK